MYDYLPKFSQIEFASIEPALEKLLAQNKAAINGLLSTQSTFTYDNLIAQSDEWDDMLNRFWSPISHLNSVMNNDALRKAYNNCLPMLSDYATEVGQNKKLCEAIKSINTQSLDAAQNKIIDNEIRDFKLSGVDLPKDKQEQYKALAKDLSELTAKFEENILDATSAWYKHITDENQLAGMPVHAITTAGEAAANRDLEGWVLTLDFPCYHAVVTYADDAALREELYIAFCTRASDQGPQAGQYDNSAVMQAILEKRAEKAKLLGFYHYAELSLVKKMVDKPQVVFDFLQELLQQAKPQAEKEYAALKQYAKRDVLNAWDVAYYSEKLRQEQFDINEEALRQYFPEAKVINGMFEIANKLYGISFKPQENIDTWHADVKFYDLYNADNQLIGHLYTDLYARDKKRGGAWMDEYQCRRVRTDGQLQLPVAYLTCNFAPTGQLSHSEVITLFHELGHCLHHLLTQINYLGVSGINGVPWDAVELPSQFFENWCWEKEAIHLIAADLPEATFERMIKAKNFHSAMFLVRQIEFALFDFTLHAANDFDIQATLDAVRNQVSVVSVPSFNRFQHGFSHIFAGGYAAGYYSYLWAEVLSADAFSKFEEDGIFNAETGRAFRQEILAKGGSIEPLQAFINFRGRKPSTAAMLRHLGVVSDST